MGDNAHDMKRTVMRNELILLNKCVERMYCEMENKTATTETS